MSRFQKINSLQAKEILEGYKKGKSISELARKYKTDRSCIYYHLEKQGIKLTHKFDKSLTGRYLKDKMPMGEKCFNLFCNEPAKYYALKHWWCFDDMDAGIHQFFKAGG